MKKIHALLPIYHDFRGGTDLCKSGKEYLNAETCKLYTSSVHNFKTFGILRAFPTINSLSYKSLNIHVKSMCYSQIWQNIGGDEYLCILVKEYLNASLCKFVVNSLLHSETFLMYHTIFYH